jgi:fatty acid desaturase
LASPFQNEKCDQSTSYFEKVLVHLAPAQFEWEVMMARNHEIDSKNVRSAQDEDRTSEAGDYHRRAWRKAIAAVRREVRANLDVTTFAGPDPSGSVALALWSLTVIAVAVYVTWALWASAGAFAGLLAYLVALLVIAREQRVLELLVHDGSHGAFSRKRGVNDLACDLIAGAPVMQLTAHYRRTHKVHHQQFGSHLDPCRGRKFMAGARGNGPLSWARSIAACLPAYLADYYGGVTSTSWRPVATALLWHGILVGGLAIGLGWMAALSTWLLFWAAPFAIVLPVIRMQAESDEHDYGERCEARGTFTNKGLLNTLLIHPAADLYHLAHHAFPAIPVSRLRRFDRRARRVSALYRDLPVRHR